MIPGSTNQLLAAGVGYQISRSVRLRSSASAYLTRTPASAGNRQTWTWSGWVKRGTLGASQRIFTYYPALSPDNQTFIRFETNDTILFYSHDAGVIRLNLITSQVFRDPSAWYHIVAVFDTTQATAANRVKLYVNGAEVTAFSTATYPAQNYQGWINNNAAHSIGSRQPAAVGEYLDGYLTEINFIDGQALTPSSFGETNPVTGVWQPKKYVGTYGTNGFYLNFSDPSAATAAAIGKDYSGNGNNWTPNNISVTAGATYDSMLDVPTPWPDGGNGRGNYAVLNPLTYGGTIDNGNLEIVTLVSYASARAGTSTIAADGGKFYWEATKLSGSSTDLSIGVCTDANSIAGSGNRFYYDATGDYIQNGSVVSTAPATYATNDIIGLAVDTTTSTIEFFKNGVSQGSYTMSFAGPYFAQVLDNTGTLQARFAINFGQRPFTYTPPSGFLALNTQNLPEPTIKKGNQYFDATTYTGNGTSQSIVNSGGMQPDLVVAKNRSAVGDHVYVDAVRGATKRLFSNLTDAESTSATSITAFNSNGFSVGADASVNGNGNSLVGWQWKEGATQGFDIVTFTGTGAAQNIAHSLGVAPRMIIMKRRNGVSDWVVGHNSLPWTQALNLNLTGAASTTATAWNNTAPTSSQFTVGSFCVSGGTYVAYLFSEVAGFSRAFSYTGNGSTDGTFVHLGFRPRFVMFKRSDAASAWTMYDTARDLFNPEQNYIQAQSSAAEAAAVTFDILANGFKLRTTGDPNVNGGTYVGMAFAESPFKFSLAR